ncbi:MAG: hypothetical protein EA376_07150 [Phycisphaeraceae bacterium]|nr:MAG: hypothetical protein EA376_07150 [Phycisphaeraceae bacterium]
MTALAPVAMYALLLLFLGAFVTLYAIRGVELLRRRGENTPGNESILKCGALAVPFLLAAFVWTFVLFMGDGFTSVYLTLAILSLAQLFTSLVPGCALGLALRTKAPILAALTAGAAATVTIWIPVTALPIVELVFNPSMVAPEGVVLMLMILLLCQAIVVWHVVFWRLMESWDADNPAPAGQRSCIECSYSLRGLDSPVCPECGHTIRAGSASARSDAQGRPLS